MAGQKPMLFQSVCLEIGSEPKLLGDADANICAEPGKREECERAAAARQSFDLHAAQRNHPEGDGTRHNDAGSRTFECLPTESAMDGEAIAIHAAAFVEREGAGANEGGEEVRELRQRDVACGESGGEVQGPSDE